VGSVAGAMMAEPCAPLRPVPVIERRRPVHHPERRPPVARGVPPAIDGLPGCPFGYQSQSFSASAVLWEFFGAHPPQ